MRARTAIAAAAAVLALARAAAACDVPVFRFALDTWAPEPYRAVVFHRGPLAAADQQAVAVLEALTATGDGTANLYVKTVDLAEDVGERQLQLWKAQATAELPWLVLGYPAGAPVEGSAWTGPLASAAGKLAGSPSRDEVARRILAGESAVWVLLESGNAQKDEAAAGVLQAELEKLTATLELPLPSGDLAGAPRDYFPEPPLRVAFSMVRIARSDPAEECLVSMLLNSETDLATLDEPMAFPVYGRGRLLYALVGGGINAVNIAGACTFLTGPCLCEYKVPSFGIGLLMTADWLGGVGQAYVAEPAAPVGEPVVAPVPPQPLATAPLRRNILLLAVSALTVLAVATIAVLWKVRRAAG